MEDDQDSNYSRKIVFGCPIECSINTNVDLHAKLPCLCFFRHRQCYCSNREDCDQARRCNIFRDKFAIFPTDKNQFEHWSHDLGQDTLEAAESNRYVGVWHFHDDDIKVLAAKGDGTLIYDGIDRINNTKFSYSRYDGKNNDPPRPAATRNYMLYTSTDSNRTKYFRDVCICSEMLSVLYLL